LPGRRPTDVELAAATIGDPQPDQPMLGVWNPVAADGSWIWNEGRPHDIPHQDGVRVVVLDAAAYQRSWNAGRAYPLMPPTLRVDGPLPPDETAHWLNRVAPTRGPSRPT
jgi:hypothetical protein